MQLLLEPLSGRFEVLDDRWLSQVMGLVAELRIVVGGVSTVGEPADGFKGTVDSIVVSLASAGSLTATVELLKAWLGRDRTRSLKASWSDGGELRTIELSGSGVDDAAFHDLVRAVTEQVAERG